MYCSRRESNFGNVTAIGREGVPERKRKGEIEENLNTSPKFF